MPEPTRPRSVLDDGSAARQRPIVKAVAELTEQFRRVADTLAPLAASLTAADAPSDASPTPAEPVRDELWSLLDWTFWGSGMGDVLREPLADAMTAAITPEQRQQALDVMEAWHASGREPVGRRRYEELNAEVKRLGADLNDVVGVARQLTDKVARVRALADRWDTALAPDRPYAEALRAALNGPLTPADEPGPACDHLLWDRNGFGVTYCTSCLAALDEPGPADA